MWRSLVARLAGGQEVIGSNPVIPTNYEETCMPFSFGFYKSTGRVFY
jgi:hypothetical protein